MINYTGKWLDLYQKALTTLKPEKFELFKFGVGFAGTDEERYRKGVVVWQMLHPDGPAKVHIHKEFHPGSPIADTPYNFQDEEIIWIIEREHAIAALRTLCEEFGDNDWPNSLDLGDIINNHLGDYLRAFDDEEEDT